MNELPEAYKSQLRKLSSNPEHQRLCEENLRMILKHAQYIEQAEHIAHLCKKFGLAPKKVTI